MTLPDLPRMLNKREAAFGLRLGKWLQDNPRFTCFFETKQTTTSSIPFSCLAPEQIAWLLAIKGPKGVLIRIIGSTGQPDYVYARNCPANVVIRFPKSFHLIDIENFLREKKQSKRRSLTESRAREISIVSV